MYVYACVCEEREPDMRLVQCCLHIGTNVCLIPHTRKFSLYDIFMVFAKLHTSYLQSRILLQVDFVKFCTA